MKNAKRIIVALVSFLMLIGFAGCGLISRTPEGEKKVVVAKGTNVKITKGDFDKRYAMQAVLIELYYGDDFLTKSENAAQVTQMKSQILDSMVQEQLVLQKAKELKVVPDDATLNKEAQTKLDDFMKAQTDQTKLDEKMKAKNVTKEDFMALFKNLVVSDKVYENVIKDIKVTDADAQQYYNQNLYDYTEKPDVMNLSHILVATEKEATDIKDKLDKGADFAALAKQYSTDTGSKEQGGALGDIQYNDKNYDTNFMTGALATPDGKVSAPVKSQFGYHIIKVNKKTEYPVKKFETVKEEIKSTMLESKKSETYQKDLTDWETKAKVTKYTDKL